MKLLLAIGRGERNARSRCHVGISRAVLSFRWLHHGLDPLNVLPGQQSLDVLNGATLPIELTVRGNFEFPVIECRF